MTRTGIDTFLKALEKIKSNKFKKAIELLDQILDETMQFTNVVSNHTFTLNEWEFINEISNCEKIINHKNTSFHGYIAISLVFKLVGNNDRRMMFLKKALAIDSNNYRIWREYAETAYQLGKMRKALQCFQEANNFKPNDPYTLEGIGLCYYYLDEPIKAVTPLRKALEIDAKNHAVMNHLAFILSEIGELNEASELISKAVKLDNKNNVYLDTQACILFLQEKYNESLKLFEKILSNKPKEYEISWDILRELYSALGLHAKAKQLEEKLLL
jgi:tetratricopeptide (TPR) repeat protein